MADKHTPGPWTLNRDYPDEIQAGSVCIAEAHGGRWSGPTSHSTYEVPAEVAANARLIAAAPDLLEALHRIKDLTPPDSQVHQIAVNAIRRAE